MKKTLEELDLEIKKTARKNTIFANLMWLSIPMLAIGITSAVFGFAYGIIPLAIFGGAFSVANVATMISSFGLSYKYTSKLMDLEEEKFNQTQAVPLEIEATEQKSNVKYVNKYNEHNTENKKEGTKSI